MLLCCGVVEMLFCVVVMPCCRCVVLLCVSVVLVGRCLGVSVSWCVVVVSLCCYDVGFGDHHRVTPHIQIVAHMSPDILNAGILAQAQTPCIR